MKKHFIYINKILIFSLFIGVLSIPTMSYSKVEEEKHADHKEHGDEHGEGEEAGHEEGIIELDEEAQEMIQLKTATVEKRLVEYRLKVFGKVAKDTEEHSYVTADEGIVGKIHFDFRASV